MAPVKAKKKLVIKDEATGLKLAEDGKSLIVDNRKQAAIAVAEHGNIQTRIDELNVELAPLLAQKELIRAGLRDFQVGKEIREISSGGWVSLLIERTKSMWVFREDDIPQNIDLSALDDPVKPFLEILREKFPNPKKRARILNKITRRVVDPNGVDLLVKEGVFTAEEVAPAYLQYIETSYVQVGPEKK